MKVGPSGQNVKSITNHADLLFTSKYPTLKLYAWDDVSVTTNSSGVGSTNVTHGFGYAPAMEVWRKGTASWSFLSGATTYPNSFFPLGSANFYADGGVSKVHASMNYYTDDDKLYINVDAGVASTTYYFRYFIWVDNIETFSSAGGPGTLGDYGFKVAKAGFDVKTAKEYQLAYSTKYKTLQFYDQNDYSEDISLPAMFASPYDTYVDEGVYIDFNHNLGFAPFFKAFAYGADVKNITSPTTKNIKLPYHEVHSSSQSPYFTWSCSGFSDATRVRIYFWRSSTYNSGTIYHNWDADTITIKLKAFYNNMAGDTNGL